MPVRKSKGNMYEWVSHVWSPIVGCSHQCTYCYVRKYRELPEVPVLNEADFPPLGKNTASESARGITRVIFVGHLTDMFCEAARPEDIVRVLEHTRKYPNNEYIFQTKNVGKLLQFLDQLPPKHVIGTTIETNRAAVLATMSKAPPPEVRASRLAMLPYGRRFLTVEPVLDFDVGEFVQMIADAKPEFINIGADSKGHGLPEPSKEKLIAFVAALGAVGVVIRKKINLTRLVGDAFGPGA